MANTVLCLAEALVTEPVIVVIVETSLDTWRQACPHWGRVSKQCPQGDVPCKVTMWILSIWRGGCREKEKEGADKKIRESSKIAFSCVVNAILELKDSWWRMVHLQPQGWSSSSFKPAHHHLYHSDVGSQFRQHKRQTLRRLPWSRPPDVHVLVWSPPLTCVWDQWLASNQENMAKVRTSHVCD